MADIDAAFEQQILDLTQRKWIADVHHHREADHLGRAIEITEGIAHRPRLRNPKTKLKPIYSDDAAAALLPRRCRLFLNVVFKRDDLHADWRTPWLRAGLLPPVVPEALAVPFDDRLWLHEHERLPPLLQHPHHGEPEDAVAVVDVWALDAALVDGDLMTERDVLEDELRSVFDYELQQVHE